MALLNRLALEPNDRLYRLSNQARDDEIYVPEVQDHMLSVTNATRDNKGLARSSNPMGEPHMTAVARTVVPFPLPVGLGAPLVWIVLLVFGTGMVVVALGSPTGTLRGSGGAPRPWRGRPVAEAPSSARAWPTTSRATSVVAAALMKERTAVSLLLTTWPTCATARRRRHAQS